MDRHRRFGEYLLCVGLRRGPRRRPDDRRLGHSWLLWEPESEPASNAAVLCPARTVTYVLFLSEPIAFNVSVCSMCAEAAHQYARTVDSNTPGRDRGCWTLIGLVRCMRAEARKPRQFAQVDSYNLLCQERTGGTQPPERCPRGPVTQYGRAPASDAGSAAGSNPVGSTTGASWREDSYCPVLPSWRDRAGSSLTRTLEGLTTQGRRSSYTGVRS